MISEDIFERAQVIEWMAEVGIVPDASCPTSFEGFIDCFASVTKLAIEADRKKRIINSCQNPTKLVTPLTFDIIPAPNPKKITATKYWIGLELPAPLSGLSMTQLTAVRKMVMAGFNAGAKS